jgi:ATP-dependent helicase/nuclease subunit A
MPFEKNTVVWASAGTGKTRKLVEIYVELIESGVDPLRIVAITFTEKAAAEMRSRIRCSISSPKILAALPAAPISTIHGFCGRILREDGLKHGIDPSFSILTEQRSLDLARQSVVETLRTEIRSGNEEISDLFGDFGLERLVESAVSAVYWLNSIGKDAEWLNRCADRQKDAALTATPELATYFEKYGSNFDAIGVLADDLDARKAKHPFKKRDDPQAPLPRIGQIAAVRTARALTQLVGLVSDRFRTKKRVLNALDFDDLLLGVRDLLRDHHDVRLYYQEYFRALLVDEFQDTDEVQAEIIELLAGDPTGKRHFGERKLMVVGDPKQSIYRFRRARVTVFFRMLEAILADGGTLEHLQENRRSAAPIAEFSNRLSESMMTGAGKEDVCSEVDVSYRIRFSDGDRLIARSGAPFLGITYVAAAEDTRAAAGREMEAEALARLLKKWKASGTIRSWKEVALLFRATTNMGLYVDALQAHDIPVYVIQGTYFYRKTEISDLIAVLELILHPKDPLLRAVVLSSSLIGMTFKDLLCGATTDALDALLTPWIDMRDRATAAEILEDVIRKTNYDVVMMAQRNGPQRVANIGKLIEITRELAREGTTGLDEIVRHLRDRAHDPNVREAEAQIVGHDDDVVRMLTVHQAKGLEFDIVIVPDLAAKTARSSSDRTYLSDQWGILAGASYGLHRKPLPHALILKGKQEEDDQQHEEEKRLLYVAITRARKMLVLGEGFSKHGGPWLQWVQKLLEQLQPGAVERARLGKTVKIRAKDFVIDVVPASLLNIPEQLRLPAGGAMIGGDAVAARYRSLLESGFPSPAQDLDLTPTEVARFTVTSCTTNTSSQSTTSLGLAAHKILQSGFRPSLNELRRRNLEDLHTVFQSMEWNAHEAESPERELPFLLQLRLSDRDCWLRGRIDAVVFGEIPKVIDYKYATWRPGAEDEYKVQLATYCLAVMTTLCVEKAMGELWFLKSPLKIIRREYTLEETVAIIRHVVTAWNHPDRFAASPPDSGGELLLAPLAAGRPKKLPS